MLTGVLAKKLRDGIGVSPSYQVQNPGAMKARGTEFRSIRRKTARDRYFVTTRPFKCLCLPPNHWTARDFRGHHCKPQGKSKTGHNRHQRNRQ
jgi:hypothetical protein